jgi:DNA invertase Pin-like site-specific DNA recombinase
MGKRRRALRAVLVARVSTEKRSQDASNPRQLANLRDVAKRRGWVVVETFSDRGSGAETGPGLRAAMRLIRQGAGDALAVCAIDRLGRDVRQMLENVDNIRQWGGSFFVLDQEIDTTSPEGRMQFTLLATLAEFQRRANRRGVIAGMEHARKKGVRLGRPRTITGRALDRAIALRQLRAPRPLWREVAAALKREGFGRFKVTTVATAVTRASAKRVVLKPPSRRALKKRDKSRGRRATKTAAV